MDYPHALRRAPAGSGYGRLSLAQSQGAVRPEGPDPANLSGASLLRTQLQGAKFRGADLTDAQLQGADYAGAQLQGADMTRTKLQEANLSGGYLQGALLAETELTGARLTGARLHGALLLHAQLEDASLEEARFQGAYVLYTNFNGAWTSEHMTQGNYHRHAQFQGVNGALRIWERVGLRQEGMTESEEEFWAAATPPHLRAPTYWPLDLKWLCLPGRSFLQRSRFEIASKMA